MDLRYRVFCVTNRYTAHFAFSSGQPHSRPFHVVSLVYYLVSFLLLPKLKPNIALALLCHITLPYKLTYADSPATI